jgi:hypothetical protein
MHSEVTWKNVQREDLRVSWNHFISPAGTCSPRLNLHCAHSDPQHNWEAHRPAEHNTLQPDHSRCWKFSKLLACICGIFVNCLHSCVLKFLFRTEQTWSLKILEIYMPESSPCFSLGCHAWIFIWACNCHKAFWHEICCDRMFDTVEGAQDSSCQAHKPTIMVLAQQLLGFILERNCNANRLLSCRLLHRSQCIFTIEGVCPLR